VGGSFAGFRFIEELISLFPIDESEAAVTDSHPVVPSRQVLAIVRDQGKNHLKRLHWGLVPFWAKDTGMGSRLINARAETLATKPSFKNAFKLRRCLIPAEGFYEWKTEKAGKQLIYLTLPDSRPFAFAGIWERWEDPANAHAIYLSCAIITTAASRSVAPVHHRMPVILDPGAYTTWLNPENRDTRALETILKTDIIGELTYRPASRRVNATEVNTPDHIRPMAQMEIDFKSFD